MCLVRHPRRVVSGFAFCDRKACVVIEVFDVVEFDAVKALLYADLHARDHNRRQDAQLADIQPTLVRPSYIAVAKHTLRELGDVRARLLPRAYIHIAIRVLTPLVNRGHGGCGITHRINHIKRYVNLKVSAGLCRIAAQLPLPLHPNGWLPATAPLCVAGNRSGQMTGNLRSQDARRWLTASGLAESQSNADKWQNHTCQGFQNVSHFTLRGRFSVSCRVTREAIGTRCVVDIWLLNSAKHD